MEVKGGGEGRNKRGRKGRENEGKGKTVLALGYKERKVVSRFSCFLRFLFVIPRFVFFHFLFFFLFITLSFYFFFYRPINSSFFLPLFYSTHFSCSFLIFPRYILLSLFSFHQLILSLPNFLFPLIFPFLFFLISFTNTKGLQRGVEWGAYGGRSCKSLRKWQAAFHLLSGQVPRGCLYCWFKWKV